MAKAYRVLYANRFPFKDSYKVPTQSNFLEIELPDTLITQVSLPVPEDFVSYFVHHEMILDQVGRYKDVHFTHFAAPFEFYLHVRKSDGLLLVQTNKQVCSSFVQDLIQTGDFEIDQYSVDFDILHPYVSYVKGAWFRFTEPDRRASAHFGNHVDRSPAYQEALVSGEMSSLHLLHDFDGEFLPVQITSDCALILYSRFQELRTELSLVLSVLYMLKGIKAISVVPAKRTYTRKSSLPAEERKTKSPAPLIEMLEENE